ncbi:MAG: isoprenylcysteine carboxylmethyltransferase family protein [Vicinamibacterales bacterium]
MKAIPIGLRLPAAGVAVDYSAHVRYAADLAARAVTIVLFSLMAVRFASDFVETGRVTGLFLLASEVLVVMLTLVRRSAVTVDRSIRARVLTTVSMMGPLLLVPAAALPFAPEAVTVALSCAGLCVVIAGKITLGRSFALLPANRGVVSNGVYRIVRHPIYMGYLVTHVAFLVASPSLWNIVALIAADAALLARAVCEERTLAQDPEYREYQTRVPWRVAPGLF